MTLYQTHLVFINAYVFRLFTSDSATERFCLGIQSRNNEFLMFPPEFCDTDLHTTESPIRYLGQKLAS